MTDAEINGCRNSLDNADCGRCPLRARCIKLGLVEWVQPRVEVVGPDVVEASGDESIDGLTEG